MCGFKKNSLKFLCRLREALCVGCTLSFLQNSPYPLTQIFFRIFLIFQTQIHNSLKWNGKIAWNVSEDICIFCLSEYLFSLITQFPLSICHQRVILQMITDDTISEFPIFLKENLKKELSNSIVKNHNHISATSLLQSLKIINIWILKTTPRI